MILSRRELLQAGVSAAALAVGGPVVAAGMRTRPIPRSGEELPVIGMGTWRTFDTAERAALVEVARTLFGAGGRVIDSSPMYGRSETTVGEVLEDLGEKKRAFLASKVWTTGKDEGIAQMREFHPADGPRRPDADPQPRRLADPRGHAALLEGHRGDPVLGHHPLLALRVRGDGEHRARGEAGFRPAPLLGGRPGGGAAPASRLRVQGVAVLVMRPFEGGSLFSDARKRPLPGWAAEIDCTTWAQIFLKFILGTPPSPAPSRPRRTPAHMADDVRAGFGRVPDEAMRRRIVKELLG